VKILQSDAVLEGVWHRPLSVVICLRESSLVIFLFLLTSGTGTKECLCVCVCVI